MIVTAVNNIVSISGDIFVISDNQLITVNFVSHFSCRYGSGILLSHFF